MSGAYVKVFDSILNSSVWCLPAYVKLVWITLLLLADSAGKVWGAAPGIARQAGVSLDECREALATLGAPDPDSRTPKAEGRRIAAITDADGGVVGWAIINAQKYREMQTDGQRRQAERSRRYRRRRREGVTLRDERDASRSSRPETEREAEGETYVPSTDGTERTAAPPQISEATAAQIDRLAGEVATITNAPAADVIREASHIEGGHGRRAASFRDPRRRGISEAWGQATVTRLAERLQYVRRVMSL